MGGGKAEPEPTAKAKRRWDGRTEISALKEKSGGRKLEIKSGERGGVRRGKAAVAVREGRRESGSWEPRIPSPCLYSAWCDPRQSAEDVCLRLSMPLFGSGVDCGRAVHTASVSFPVVLSPVDSQTEYAWFSWGERDPFFPPKEPRGVGPPQNPHITSTRSPRPQNPLYILPSSPGVSRALL